MFCRLCGADNEESSLYCHRDGEKLKKAKGSGRLAKGEAKFCKECGEGVDMEDLYCPNCGFSLYVLEDSKIAEVEKGVKSLDLNSNFKPKSLVKYASLAFGMVFFIGIFLSSLINSALSDYTYNSSGFRMPTKVLGAFDSLAIINGNLSRIDFSSGGNDIFRIDLRFMVFALALVPIAVFLLMGLYRSRKSNKENRAVSIRDSLVISLIYGIFVALAAFIAGGKLDFRIPGFFIGRGLESLEIKNTYSFFGSFFRASLIAFGSLNLGRGLYGLFSSFKDGKKEFKPLSTSVFILGVNLLLLSIYILIVGNAGEVFEAISSMGFFEGGFLLQVVVYLFLLINTGTLVSGVEDDIEKISLFSELENLNESFANTWFLYFILLVTLALFFLLGRRLKKRGKGLKELVYSPLIFSLGLAILAYLTKISMVAVDYTDVVFTYGESIFYGVETLSIFLSSFSFFLLSSFAGYFISGGQGQVEVLDE